MDCVASPRVQFPSNFCSQETKNVQAGCLVSVECISMLG